MSWKKPADRYHGAVLVEHFAFTNEQRKRLGDALAKASDKLVQDLESTCALYVVMFGEKAPTPGQQRTALHRLRGRVVRLREALARGDRNRAANAASDLDGTWHTTDAETTAAVSLALFRREQGHVGGELRLALRELRDCLQVAEQLPSLLDELDAAAGEALRELPPQGRPREDGLRFLAGRVAQVLRQHGFNPTPWSEEAPRGSNTEPLASRFVRCLDVVFSAHGNALSRRQVLRYASDALRAKPVTQDPGLCSDRCRSPQSDGPVGGARSDARAVRAEGNGVHEVLVSHQGRQ